MTYFTYEKKGFSFEYVPTHGHICVNNYYGECYDVIEVGFFIDKDSFISKCDEWIRIYNLMHG